MGSINITAMWENEKVADIVVDYTTNTVEVINYTDYWVKRPFGVVENPSIDEFEEMLESRCFPKERANCDQLLKDLGLRFYDPLAIVRKTKGIMSDDYMWLRFDGEEVEYNDIRLRK